MRKDANKYQNNSGTNRKNGDTSRRNLTTQKADGNDGSKDLTIQETAEALGISCQAVHKRIKAGTLDAHMQNHRWCVSKPSVEYAIISIPHAGRPYTAKRYILMNATHPVLSFSYQEASGNFTPHEVFDGARAPVGTITRNGRGNAQKLKEWWEHRCIPESREQMNRKLRELGVRRPSLIPFRNLGLSLSDQYWVCPEGEKLRWEDINYFDNDFGAFDISSKNISSLFDKEEQIGNTTYLTVREPFDRKSWVAQIGLSTPDNTSEGVLPKRWVCLNGERLLFKGHSPWTDQQVYNEAVATALYRRILSPQDYVPYRVVALADEPTETKANRQSVSSNTPSNDSSSTSSNAVPSASPVASVCPCFIQSDEEYVTAASLMSAYSKHKGETDYDALVRYARNVGIPRTTCATWLSKMLVCDTILANADRHFRNFGFVRNIETLTWSPAPLFDSGNCLWFDASEDAVLHDNYTYAARPFGGTAAKQLWFVEDTSWLDVDALEGFSDEAIEILSQSDSTIWKLDYIKRGIEAQINLVRQIV